MLKDSPNTIRRHFSGLTAKVAFDKTLVSVKNGEQKRITVDSQQWSEFMQELVAPDGTKRVEIEITSAFDTPIYVDDISLIKVK